MSCGGFAASPCKKPLLSHELRPLRGLRTQQRLALTRAAGASRPPHTTSSCCHTSCGRFAASAHNKLLPSHELQPLRGLRAEQALAVTQAAAASRPPHTTKLCALTHKLLGASSATCSPAFYPGKTAGVCGSISVVPIPTRKPHCQTEPWRIKWSTKGFCKLLRSFVCASVWHKMYAISERELTPACGSKSVPKLAANLRVHWCHSVLTCFVEVKKRLTIIIFVALLRHRLGGLCVYQRAKNFRSGKGTARDVIWPIGSSTCTHGAARQVKELRGAHLHRIRATLNLFYNWVRAKSDLGVQETGSMCLNL